MQQFIEQNQKLMQLLSANNEKSGRKNTNRTHTTSTVPCQGKPRLPMLAYFGKYCWTHGRISHKGRNFNYKAPGHKDKITTESKMDIINYRFT